MPSTKSTLPRPSAEVLRQLYIEQRLGCPDIGRLFQRDPSTVRHWLVAAGIPTRPRGSNERQHFKAGQRSAFAGRKHGAESIEKIRAATIADGRVPYLRDGRHWLADAPAEVNPNWKGGATPERQEFYRTPEWKAACAAVWARDDACCRRCHLDWRTVDRSTTPTFHVHHVFSFQIRATRANPDLLVLLCRPCHLFVHSKANVTREWLPQDANSPVMLPGLDDLGNLPAFDFDRWLASERRGREAYLQAAERETSMPSLFDVLDEVEA